ANVLYSTTYTFVSAAIKPEYVSAVISANALPSINAPRTWVSVSASLNDALGSLSYSWALYEGTTASGAVVRTSTDPNPQFTNLKGNTQYTVVATVSNTNGGLAADINPLISNQLTFTTAAIIPNPIFPSVYIHDINVYANPMVTPITLPNYSNDNAGGTFSFVWDFGDGYTTTDVNPTHFYATGGPKTITLTATNSNGGLSASVSRNINIVITPKAKISVSVNTTDPLHNTVSFFADNTLNPSLNSSIVSGSITAYNWQIQMTQISTGITTSMTVSNNPIVVLDLGADLNDYTITAEVTAVSDLGVTDAATATWSNSGVNSGYTPFGGIRVGGGAAFIRVNRVIDEAMQIGVFPNPTVSTIQLGYPVIKGEFVNIIIVDPMGRVVRSERRGATVGVRNNAQLNVQNLAKGTYHVIIVSADGKRIGTTKFVKAK
ncbi:MAG: PKD domain-containing protein, partial [Chitinophagaceae bacterium]